MELLHKNVTGYFPNVNTQLQINMFFPSSSKN